MSIPPELRKLYSDGRIIPFIGAGVSKSVQWQSNGVHHEGPLWREMVDEAARQLGFEIPDLIRTRGTDLQLLEYFKLTRQDIAPLTNWLVTQTQAPDKAIQESAILTALTELTQCNVFYTTNYDNFLERALSIGGRRPQTIATEAHMGSAMGDAPQVVKFHGDLDHPSHLVVTESDYEQRLAFKTAMDWRLRSDLFGRAVLFLGYSFRDPNVAYLFRLINEQFQELAANPTGRRAYIVVSDPSDFEARLFRARNIEVIGINGGKESVETAEVLRLLWS